MRSGRSACLAALAALAAACDATPFRTADIDVSPGAQTQPAPASAPSVPVLRFSVAAVESPRDTFAAYSTLFERLGNRLGVQIEFVQRRTYREVNDLLASGRLDAALVCTGGYLDLKERTPAAVEVLAVPVADGVSTYESLVIVPAASRAETVSDLAGKRFAFTDELSFTGRAYLVQHLRALGHDPERFFSGVTYTQSHDRSVSATARGLVDGATVHSRVYAHMLAREPRLAKRVRVLHRSPSFGMMPIVASTRLSPEERARLRRVLLDLARDPEAAAALATLGLEGFAVAPPGLFDSAAEIVARAR